MDVKMGKQIPNHALKLAARLSKESGVPLDNILHDHKKKSEEVAKKTRSLEGKFKILSIDKFDGSDFVYEEYDTAEEALTEARRLTDKAKPLASDHSVATVYLAYDPNGKYLGGDTWVGE